jgi:hypothetical protein
MSVPVLRAMGTSVLRTGDVGSGQAMKALNNLVSAGGFLIGIEALLIDQRFGLDPAVMVDVLNAATGMNNSAQKKFKQFVLSRKFDAGFTMGLLAKDLSIALQVGRDTETPTPLSALTKEMVTAAQAMFGSDADHTGMAKLCERLGGRSSARADMPWLSGTFVHASVSLTLASADWPPHIRTSALFARVTLGQIRTRDLVASGISDEKYYGPHRADRRYYPE